MDSIATAITETGTRDSIRDLKEELNVYSYEKILTLTFLRVIIYNYRLFCPYQQSIV